MTSTLPRWINLAKEAAVIIGAIASFVVLAAQALSAEGLIVPNDLPRTFINFGMALAPLIAATFTRQRVYSEKTVETITGTPIAALPPPP